jgi:hypothetical protein
MLERGGKVVIKMMAKVQQETIMPMMSRATLAGTTVFTEEYSINCLRLGELKLPPLKRFFK